jgi:ABC-type sugar transport system permease subunit
VNENMVRNILHSSSDLASVRKWVQRNKMGYLFILPAVLLYAIFFIYPFADAIYLSLTDWNGVDPQKTFVGLNNYIRMVKDQLMWLSLSRNAIWVIIGTVVPIAIALILAVLLGGRKTKGRLFFRTVYFMPVVLSSVVVGIIWGWVYNPVFGMLNRVLGAIGLGSLSRGWLGDPNLAIYMVLIAAIWSYLGFCVVILLAGLQNVNLELYDAARCDGANSLQQLIHVTIPQLYHVLTMIGVYSMINGFHVFDIVFVMTRGGPANSTEVIATYTYKQGFQLNSLGYGSALGMVLALLSLITSYIFIKFRERSEV